MKYTNSLFGLSLQCLIIVLFALSHTPYCLPTFPIALTPMMALWRGPLAPSSAWKVAAEALVVGVMTGFLATYHIPLSLPHYAWLLHLIACVIFSLQFVAVGLTIFGTRAWSHLLVVPLVVFIALIAELVQYCFIGVTWVLSNPPLAVASTPIAQWSGVITPLGLSAALYTINFLWLPEWTQKNWRRWLSPVVAISIIGGLWIGGLAIENQVQVRPLSFSALLVQPSPSSMPGVTERTKQDLLHQLTLTSLKVDGPVDLIVWPELCLRTSSLYDYDKHRKRLRLLLSNSGALDNNRRFSSNPVSVDLLGFESELYQHYNTNCLLGVPIIERTGSIEDKINQRESSTFGQGTSTFNCACLVNQSELQCHQKLVLVPFYEYLPWWLDHARVRAWFKQRVNTVPMTLPGHEYRPLTFKSRDGQTQKVAVAICYETWFPWLPQFRSNDEVNAICHLVYDGRFIDHPEIVQRMLLAVRLRAIETRQWQLVCSYFRGTAVIDPRGRIVQQMELDSGFLRTDQTSF